MTAKLGNNLYIPRSVEPKIEKYIFKGKVVIIYGARQTGKTTLVKKILARHPLKTKYISCDNPDQRLELEQAETSSNLKQVIGNNKIIVFDEAQKVKDIGIKLKLLVDNFPEQQIIATGSSSFNLANRIKESLTGRTFEFYLHPLSIKELGAVWDKTEIYRQLENLLIYGSYPAVINAASLEEKATTVKLLADQYLYKDVLSFEKVRKSEFLKKFLEAIALQTGNEVSYNELSNLLSLNKQTIMSYLDILEQGFILFRLTSFSRNLRQEINRSRKIYLLDNGIRNALINNLNPVNLRADKGALWENFVVSEFKKQQFWPVTTAPLYFWRTYDQAEIDLVKDTGGKLAAFEIKWQKAKNRPPKNFVRAYPNSTFHSITSENFLDFLKL